MYRYSGNSRYNYGCSSTTNERRYRSEDGATIVRDASERVTSFRYSDFDPFYHFEYGKEGTVCSIDRTDGWNWRRVKSNEFDGWVVRNYWDCWKVKDIDCSVRVDDNGIRVVGSRPENLALPECK